MKLVTLARGAHGQSGAMIGDEVLDFCAAAALVPQAATVPGQTIDILVIGSSAYQAAAATVAAVTAADQATLTKLRNAGALLPAAQCTFMAPIPQPKLVLSHGSAYHSHALDWDRNAPRERPNHPPAGFIKANGSITGTGQPIIAPRMAPDMIDYEGELSVVFGRRCHQVSAKDAWDYIVGFTIINDVSAREWVPRKRPEVAPTVASALNMLFKNFPTFCPMGPNVTTKDEFADLNNLHLTTRLNGKVMQDSWTRDLIWNIPELIEFYSGIFPFEPGDVMSTGTPGGVGMGHQPPVFMRPGDVCSVTVDGIGTLQNHIVAAS